MIRARIRYPNNQTQVRSGTTLINACLAAGHKIIRDDPANYGLDGIYTDKDFEQPEDVPEKKGKRARITKA